MITLIVIMIVSAAFVYAICRLIDTAHEINNLIEFGELDDLDHRDHTSGAV
jgi:hypothetical protein